MVAGGTRIVGNFELSDSFHLDGSMQGTVVSDSDVSIGRSGSFDGDITAKHVLVSGRFEGQLDADRLEIVASGRVTGEVRVRELVIEAGGQFNGASHIKQANEEPRRLSQQPEALLAEPGITETVDDSELKAAAS